MNIYTLLRNWFDFSFNNPEKINPNHTALYVFAIEHCNRLGWKEKFGLPTTMAKEAIGIRSYNTYKKTLQDLVDFGFIEMIEISKNQYSSNIVALSKFDKALDKALDKASVKHTSKQSESTHQSIDSIDRQVYNNTNIPITNLPLEKEKEKGEKILIPITAGKFSEFNIQDAPAKILQDALEAWVYSTDVELRKKITIDHVKDKWQQFYATNKDSIQWYNSENEIYTHFKRWITKQKFINGNAATKNTGTKLGTSDARIDAIAKW